ncbi:MAG: mechanosensitive ion channel family protein [Deltaproteobacteria bacterium]|nr:mechanosensitive ion channel family protein [Deltaproteobacteria bacterium]
MSEFLSNVVAWLKTDQALAIFKAALILLAGLLIARLISRRLKLRRLHEQQSMILRKVLVSVVLAVAVLWSLRELGLDMGVLLGAAGILTVAIGFASQTSASNIISGIFLMGERPFQIGDVVQVGQTTGYVLAIDFLAVKLRTFDNLLVRIPNETMLKSEVTNYTRFAIRRVDLQIGVAYKEDLARVREILFAIARRDPLALDEPSPLFLFKGFGASAIEIQFSVWSAQESFYPLRTRLYMDIKAAFDAEGIEIPFPHLSLYTGSATSPLPVQLVEKAEAGGAAQSSLGSGPLQPQSGV